MSNKVADYNALEREYVTSPMDISYRELARRHGMNHSLIVVAANKPDRTGRTWKDKRAEYKARAIDATIEKAADSVAEKEVAMRGLVIDAVVEYLHKFREEIPDMRTSPQGLAAILDKALLFLGKANAITEGRSLGVSVHASKDDLARILELTSGVAGADAPTGTDRPSLPRIESGRPN